MKETNMSDANKGSAGQDRDIVERLKRHPDQPDAKLDVALDESMDASDPPAVTIPGAGDVPAPSSGYDEEEERKRAEKNGK
jgi:hypothetical protein